MHLLLFVVPFLALCACVPLHEEDSAVSDASDSSSSVVSQDAVPMGHAVSYGENDAYSGYMAVPEGEGPFPALIVIHEWWGLNDNIRWYADAFAREGYITLAVDLYGEPATQNPEEAQRLATSVREHPDAAFANLEAAVAYLRAQPMVHADRLGSVGWCFGGQWSYRMAVNDMGVQATVMYYGQFAPDDDLEMMKSHIIGHFGEEDQSIPVEDVRTFRARLHDLSGEHEIYIYPNAGHGFARELETSEARTAWDRTLRFLAEEL